MGLGFRVQGFAFRVSGLGFRVYTAPEANPTHRYWGQSHRLELFADRRRLAARIGVL